MSDRYQKQWENLGSCDPYWAVLSDPEKKGGKWNKDEFFSSGHREIEQVMNNLFRLHQDMSLGTALDFGCGVGRLSRALSKYFNRIIGIDISKSMLDEAREQHQDFHNIEFIHIMGNDLSSIPSNTIDLVYSNIVLQHMPAKRQLLFIGEFCRILRPGGIAVFQTPSRQDLTTITGWIHFLFGNRLLNLARRVKHGKHGVMEIHTLLKDNLLTHLDHLNMHVAEIERYDSAGRGFISYRYYAMKRA